MFNVGGGEMVMLGILALLVFGPEGLPGVIKSVMRTVRALRSAAGDFQNEVKSALDDEHIRQDQAKRKRIPAPTDETPELDVPASKSLEQDPAQPASEESTELEAVKGDSPASDAAPETTVVEEAHVESSGELQSETVETETESETEVTPANIHPETKEFLYGQEDANREHTSEEEQKEEEEEDDDDGPGLPMRTAKERAKD